MDEGGFTDYVSPANIDEHWLLCMCTWEEHNLDFSSGHSSPQVCITTPREVRVYLAGTMSQNVSVQQPSRLCCARKNITHKVATRQQFWQSIQLPGDTHTHMPDKYRASYIYTNGRGRTPVLVYMGRPGFIRGWSACKSPDSHSQDLAHLCNWIRGTQPDIVETIACCSMGHDNIKYTYYGTLVASAQSLPLSLI